ncbi:hypothetical protein [Micromonospora carbonacea]|uniref:Uncharacterized protein n=1 Tax=Micromonospora carbonacea TaxID=47853 RepID=A0A1C4X0H7_9ACTN|nr:hypothetical protein [Micromonospora carbonacea]SCF01956.1 hypothetical protein GA0070563_104147 [Micromonospora carbonacea]
MMHDHTGPRRYRLKIYDGQYEVLHNRTHVVDVDLDSPTMGGVLDRQLAALTRAALDANEPMDRPRLEVVDPETGDVVLDWTGA